MGHYWFAIYFIFWYFSVLFGILRRRSFLYLTRLFIGDMKLQDGTIKQDKAEPIKGWTEILAVRTLRRHVNTAIHLIKVDGGLDL